MGPSSLTSWIYYITVTHHEKKIPLAFFGDRNERGTEIYKDGEKIASGQWVRPKL